MRGRIYFNSEVKNEQQRQELFSKMDEFTSNAEKIEYAASKVDEIVCTNSDGTIRKNVPPQAKNSDQSRHFRMEGNKLFENHKLVESIEMYNRSICYAEKNSEDLGMGFANRSAVYFQLKRYDLCLENIHRATQNGYPTRLIDKLMKRQSGCMIHLNDNYYSDIESDKPLTPTLSFPPHLKVPFAGNCLEFRENDEFGRHIVTNADLEAGQVVVIEDSYSAFLNVDFIYQRCANCLMENNFNLIPCENCTSTMYCDEKCAVEAQKNFHRIECPIIEIVLRWYDCDALRTCIRAICGFGHMDELRSFIEDTETDKINAFTLNYSDNISSSELYTAIHTLKTNQGKRPTSEIFDFAAFTDLFYKVLTLLTPLSESINTENDKKLLLELIFHHLQIASINRNNLEHQRYEFKDGELKWNHFEYGFAAYSLISLFNHACSPNVIRISYGRRSAIIVSRPVKAGEQLFINYGYYPEIHELNKRQNELESRYKFECQCNACQLDYPLLAEQKNVNFPINFARIECFRLGLAKICFAKGNLLRYANLLNKNQGYTACTSFVYRAFVSCLTTLYNSIPLRMIDQDIATEMARMTLRVIQPNRSTEELRNTPGLSNFFSK